VFGPAAPFVPRYGGLVKIKFAAVQLKPGTEPLFIGAPEVMRGLDRELRWADRPMTRVQVRRGTKLMRALDKGAEGLGLRVRESGSWERNTRPSQASYGLYFDGGGLCPVVALSPCSANRSVL
jgi:hypothetical protein